MDDVHTCFADMRLANWFVVGIVIEVDASECFFLLLLLLLRCRGVSMVLFASLLSTVAL